MNNFSNFWLHDVMRNCVGGCAPAYFGQLCISMSSVPVCGSLHYVVKVFYLFLYSILYIATW